MSAQLQRIAENLSAHLPEFLAAFAVLLLGWILALVTGRAVRSALERTTLEDRLGRTLGEDEERLPPLGELGGRITFWTVMILVVLAFFQILGLDAAGQPLEVTAQEIFAFLPNLLSAALLAVVAWLVARLLRLLVVRAARRTRLDARLEEEAGDGLLLRPSESLGEATYWLVLVLFVPAILQALQLEGLLEPVSAVLADLLGFLPDLLGAAVLLLAGWFLAHLLRRVVTSLLMGWGLDRFGRDLGLETPEEARLSEVVGHLVYILVLLPVIIAALNVLGVETITEPATAMLERFLVTIPNLVAAALLVAIAYLVARVLGRITTRTLAAAGFDEFVSGLRFLPGWLEPTEAEEERSPEESEARAEPAGRGASEMVGYLVVAAVVLLSTVEALELLEFTVLADMVARFLFFAADVLTGLLLFGLGLYLAEVAAETIRSSSVRRPEGVARAARLTIVVLAAFMALSQMGVADDIILLSFGLLLGAVAVAAAIAFGAGGRELARIHLERWLGGGAAGATGAGGARGPADAEGR